MIFWLSDIAKGAAPSREPAAPSALPLWARLENKGLTSYCYCVKWRVLLDIKHKKYGAYVTLKHSNNIVFSGLYWNLTIQISNMKHQTPYHLRTAVWRKPPIF